MSTAALWMRNSASHQTQVYAARFQYLLPRGFFFAARQYLYGNNELNLAEAPNETDEVFEENSQPTEPACDESGDDEMNSNLLLQILLVFND